MTDLFNQLRGAISIGIPDEVLGELIDELTTSYQNHQRWKSALDKNKVLMLEADRTLIFEVLKRRRARVIPQWCRPTVEFLKKEGQ